VSVVNLILETATKMKSVNRKKKICLLEDQCLSHILQEWNISGDLTSFGLYTVMQQTEFNKVIQDIINFL
jgi:hypothetical protein